MNFHSTPDTPQKLALMGELNYFEQAGDREALPVDAGGMRSCITHVQTPKGPKPVLKAMITTACQYNCFYCPFRAGRSQTRRVNIKPDEMARTFDQLQRARIADGIFLSSGIIKDSIASQDKIIDTIEIIRRDYAYQGYIHLKIMPGAERDQLVRAMQLADRVSINLEGPTPQRLDRLAPKKDFSHDLLERLTWAHQIKEASQYDPTLNIRASIVTQFVVGAVNDTDLELLSMSDRLYRMGLARAYYSRFNPIEGTPFENLPATSPQREFRLYQASFLLRDYQWDIEDLPFEGLGNLRLDVDPKKAWADRYLREQPVDVMKASRNQLMRIPGIGPKNARAIIQARKRGQLSDLSHLRAIGVRGVEQLAPYILFNGQRPPHQLILFD